MAEKQSENSALVQGRGRGRPFRPGKSGNPKGRPPKGTSLAECIRSVAGENGAAYVERLHSIAIGENARYAIAAIAVLLDRGYGKVMQDLRIEARPDVRQMSDQELEAEILALAEQINSERAEAEQLKIERARA